MTREQMLKFRNKRVDSLSKDDYTWSSVTIVDVGEEFVFFTNIQCPSLPPYDIGKVRLVDITSVHWSEPCMITVEKEKV